MAGVTHYMSGRWWYIRTEHGLIAQDMSKVQRWDYGDETEPLSVRGVWVSCDNDMRAMPGACPDMVAYVLERWGNPARPR